ncbi:MAG: S8 family peptidase, partial [Bacteroidetes bacterium]|nr:S8 family peptidase [Bacteroidota bacterium]
EYQDKHNIIIVKLGENGNFIHEDRYPSDCLDSDDYPIRMEYFSGLNQLIVIGKNQISPNVFQYYDLRYDYLSRSIAILKDSIGTPLCKSGEIVVKFNKAYLKENVVDNFDLSFGILSDFLTTEAVDSISSILPNGRSTKMIRIFSTLKTTDTISISRLGDTVRVPDFWTVFILTIPESTSTQITNLCLALEDLYPYVIYAHQNSIVFSSGCPDTEPNESQSGGAVYPAQSSVHPTSSYPNSHINVLSAWGCTVGKPDVKVGVFDDLILRNHEDFEFNPNSGPYGFSAVKGGWDYENQTCIHCTNPAPAIFTLHGTQVAGIIGAVRNNEIGIAGVAGGNWDGNEGSEGVSLYSIRVIGNSPYEDGLLYGDLKFYADAIIDYSDMPEFPDPCCGDENPHKCIRVDIMNHSLGYYLPTTLLNTELVEEAVHFAYMNQVIFCAARGNGGLDRIACPACYNDWAINVSATNSNGDGRLSSSNFGSDIDIAAPGSNTNVYTTAAPNNYSTFQMTSAATPHVSGVAGLLLSLDNVPGNLPNNGSGYSLSPEDVQEILYLTAKDIDVPGPDDETGPGLLDAGNAVSFLLDCDFYHFNNSNLSPTWSAPTLEQSNIDIQFDRNYTNSDDVFFAKNTAYKADVYRVTATFNHNIGKNIQESWTRPSSSNTFGLYSNIGGTNMISPKENCFFESVDANQAIVSGYTYVIKNTSGSVIGYAPLNPASSSSDAKFAYSLSACGSVGTIESITPDLQFQIVPNPASLSHTIIPKLESSENEVVEIAAYNAVGSLIQLTSTTLNNSPWRFDLSSLPAGYYFYRITVGHNSYTLPFIKVK